MLKFHKTVSMVFGVLFFIILKQFQVQGVNVPISILIALSFGALVTWYNYWYLNKIQKYNLWVLIRPLLLFLSSFALIFVIPSLVLKGLFLLAVVILVAFIEMFLGNFSENILLNESLIIAFGFLTAFFALREYMPARLFWGVLGTFVSIALITRSFYEFVPQPSHVKVISALLIALFCSQIFWAMNFLHFHFSAFAIILLNIFYLSLILNYHSFFKVLSPKKIYFHIIFFAFTTGVVLLATPWKISD